MKKSHKYILGILASIVIIIGVNMFEYYEKEKKTPPKYPKLSSKQEKVLKAKYKISDSDSIKCNSSMYVENKTYDYYTGPLRNDIYDLKWQGNLNVTDNKLFYITYIITHTDDYIITYINNHQCAIKLKAPISEDDRKFLLNNFLYNNMARMIIYPFNNPKKIILHNPNEINGYYFVDLSSKNIKKIDSPQPPARYHCVDINYKENVAVAYASGTFITPYNYVFDEDGNFICRYEE